MRVDYQVVRGSLSTWKTLFEDAARVASEVGPDRLIGFSHSEDRSDSVITVWYWHRPVNAEPATSRQAAFHIVRGTFTTWDSLFREAAEFAAKVGPDRLIGLSHSADKQDGVITVWYWEE